MAKKIEYNENYAHECNCTKVNLDDYKSPLYLCEDCTPEMFAQIIGFYVNHALILAPDKKVERNFGLRSIKDLGYRSSSEQGRLEKQLKSTANMELYFLKSDSIDNTIESMNLEGKICICHARAVLKQSFSPKFKEDGSVDKSKGETRLICLFRHIRNSLAHGCTYDFKNGYIMLEDSDEDKKLTARILIKLSDLYSWISIIDPDYFERNSIKEEGKEYANI